MKNLNEEKQFIDTIISKEWKEKEVSLKDIIEKPAKELVDYRMDEWVSTPENEDSSAIDKVGSTVQLVKEAYTKKDRDVTVDGVLYNIKYTSHIEPGDKGSIGEYPASPAYMELDDITNCYKYDDNSNKLGPDMGPISNMDADPIHVKIWDQAQADINDEDLSDYDDDYGDD